MTRLKTFAKWVTACTFALQIMPPEVALMLGDALRLWLLMWWMRELPGLAP
jgi:hypothetical protein